MEKNYEQYAEFRKTWSIAFFNATNAAISMVGTLGAKDIEEAKGIIVPFRDWLLDEHKKYYVENIAPAGGLSMVDPNLKNGLDRAKKSYEDTTRP